MTAVNKEKNPCNALSGMRVADGWIQLMREEGEGEMAQRATMVKKKEEEEEEEERDALYRPPPVPPVTPSDTPSQ